MADKYERPDEVTDAEWAQFLAEINHVEDCLLKRVCPDCGNKLTKKLDERQVGGSEARGLWFNYRCTNPQGCEFFVDQCESN